jgi:TetR/AcrR family transcriptional repressor of nem operon
MELFWQRGYEGTSTATLISTLGIARSSLYATFGSKEQLYAEALDRYVEDLRARVIARLQEEGEAFEVLERFFTEVIQRGNAGAEPLRCCMLVRATLARDAQPLEIKTRIHHAIAELDDAFLALLTRASGEGHLSPNTPLASSARFLTSTFQAINLAALGGRSTTDLREIAQRALASIQSTRTERDPT